MEKCLNLEFPPDVLLTCCKLKTGEALQLKGTDRKLDGKSDVIKMHIRRHSDVICFSLHGFEKLEDIWQCSFLVTDIALTNVEEDVVTENPSRHLFMSSRKIKQHLGRVRKTLKGGVAVRGNNRTVNISSKDEEKPVKMGVGSVNGCDFILDKHEHKNTVKRDSKDGLDLRERTDSSGDIISGETQVAGSDRAKTASNERKKLRRRRVNRYVCYDPELYMLNRAVILAMRSKLEESEIRQECLICGEVFVQAYNLPHHIKRYHGISVEEYKDFLRSPAEERQEKIAAFWQLALLNKQLGLEESGSVLSCLYCNELQSGVLAMRYHLKVKHPKEAGLIGQTQDYTMMARQRKAHQGTEKKNRYPCRYCGIMLAFVCSRSRHENYHCEMNPSKKKLFCCTNCGKYFRTSSEMHQHKTRHGSNDSKFICDVCGKVTCTKSGLYQHKMKEHSGLADRFSCQVCSKTFFAKDKYHRHLTVHVDLRPFVCELCGKTFKTKQAVMKHQRSVHDNKYPYYCNRCGHGVEKIQYLKSHRCGHVRRTQLGSDGRTTTDGANVSEPELPAVTKVQNPAPYTQHTVSTSQAEMSTPQCVLPGAIPGINTQRADYVDHHQVAAEAVDQHYLLQENPIQAYMQPLTIPLSQYSQVNYIQFPETERQQINLANINSSSITSTPINNSGINNYNKSPVRVNPF